MRTTIRIDDRLLAEAKAQAALSGRTLNALVEDALRQTLARREHGAPAQRAKLPTHRGSHLVAGVDLDDTASLLDLMDARRS